MAKDSTAEYVQTEIVKRGSKIVVDGDFGPISKRELTKQLGPVTVADPVEAAPDDKWGLKKTGRQMRYMVVHCSATRPMQKNIGVKDIRAWHKQRGWSDIGYHYVIKRDGVLELGRNIDKIGAHVGGHNTGSLGICMVGGINDDTLKPENNFTDKQWAALKRLLTTLSDYYPKAKVRGHRDFPKVAKACPCFNAIPWANRNGFNGG